jgi:hypothetical protein
LHLFVWGKQGMAEALAGSGGLRVRGAYGTVDPKLKNSMGRLAGLMFDVTFLRHWYMRLFFKPFLVLPAAA